VAQILFRGGSVFDGATIRTGVGVLVEGDAIAAVAPVATFDGYAGPVHDTAGMTLMPGLIDAHVHLAFDASDAPDGLLGHDDTDSGLDEAVAARASAALQSGFVALRDCGGPGTTEFRVRDALAGGRIDGPVVQACGRMIRKALDGFGDRVAFGADDSEIADAVRTVAASGADFINIMTTINAVHCGDAARPQYTDDAVARGVDAAGALGLKAISNAQCAEDVAAVARAGVASVEQGSLMDDAALEAMLAHDVVLVPILLARHNMDRARIERGGDADAIDAAAALAEQTRETARRYVAAGGRIAVGTDCGAPGSAHGANGDELALLRDAGLSSLDVARAATAHGADLMGLEGYGRIAEGAAASLIVVAGEGDAALEWLGERAALRGVWHCGLAVG